MPSTITISIETDGGPRRDLHTVTMPDAAPEQGRGSRLQAERLAAQAASIIAQRIGDAASRHVLEQA